MSSVSSAIQQVEGLDSQHDETGSTWPPCNFDFSVLKIGNWSWTSMKEGDLVAKFHYQTQMMMWEIKEHGFKRKMLIRFSEIVDLNADLPKGQPGTLTITLANPPKFYHGIKPQSRRQIQWQITSDFTDGFEASNCMKHILQCPPGILLFPLQILFKSDMRLRSLYQAAASVDRSVRQVEMMLNDDNEPADTLDETLVSSAINSFQNLLKSSDEENQVHEDLSQMMQIDDTPHQPFPN